MNGFNRRKLRNESIRAQWWDYSREGAYFLTICTKDRFHYFGEIREGKMNLTVAGKIATNIWQEIPNHFPFIKLGEYIVMPDHIHGIIIIGGKRLIASPQGPKGPRAGGITGNKNPMLHQNISRVIRWYKGRSSFEIRRIRNDFYWQSRFYDRIIRNKMAFERISEYIKNNPEKWEVKYRNRP